MRRLAVLTWLLAAVPLAAQSPAPPAHGASPAPAASPGARREPPPVTFAVEVGYVEVDAIVTDKNDQPVRDLTRDDFTVLEDGKPQSIDLFTAIDLPYERPEPAAPLPVPLDVQTNARPFEGRVYVIVMDELHTSASRSLLVRAAAHRFIERHFGEGDLAAVVHTGAGAASGQNLTGDRRLLLAAVDRFVGRKIQSVTQSRIDEYNRTQQTRQQGDPVNDPQEMERAYNARASLDTLRSVSEWLAGLRGRRKAVLFLSEGIDYNLYDQINNKEASSVLESVKDATAAAVQANVSFYAIDPRGLGGLSDEMMEIQPVFDDPSLRLDTTGLADDLRLSQDSLRVLADETSGFAAVNTNDFTSAFTRIVKDNSAYYVLGYYPPGQRKDGKFHKIEVKVARSGLHVRARSGYTTQHAKPVKPPTLAGGEAPPPVLAQLLYSPLARPGLPMQMQATAFQGQGGKEKAVLTLEVAGSGFKFNEKDGAFHDTLDLAILTVDQAGKTAGTSQKVQLNLKPRSRQLVEATGFRVLSALDVAPGRYQIRIAGRAENSDSAGSVFYDLDVPDFGKQSLALSGLVLTSSFARLVPTAGQVPLLKDALPAPPTASRVFYAFDTLALFAEIYDGEATAHTLDVATTLTGSDGSVAYRSADERSTAARKGDAAGAPLVQAVQIPLKDVPPGIYTLRLDVKSRLGKKPPAAERALMVQVLAAPASPAPTLSPPGP